mgnify:CR=1 FL=1
MKNEYGIEEDIFNNILDTFKSIEEIERVILFGSRAKNTYKNTSDIDLAVKFKKIDKKLLLIRKLDEIKCILKFDVLNLDNISNEKLLENIKKEGKVIYINKE